MNCAFFPQIISIWRELSRKCMVFEKWKAHTRLCINVAQNDQIL